MTWGERTRPPLVMWHGLARTCRDFDDIAAALSHDWFIIAPDTIGRGLSQWSTAPDVEYCNSYYAALATALLDTLGIARVDWLGTSMGGAIAIRAAAGPLAGRIRKLILNDMGPEISATSIERIRGYAGSPPRFDRVSELEDYFRTIYKPYGFLTDAQWRRMTETSMRRLPDGGVTTHYDPNMVMQFTHHSDDYAQWQQWDSLLCDVLCLRGEDSDLLLAADAERMTTRGPQCEVVTVPGCGHAPALNVPEQIQIVASFLNR